MLVYINSKEGSAKRILIEVKKIKETPARLLVQLPCGRIIYRKKKRDIPQEVVESV